VGSILGKFFENEKTKINNEGYPSNYLSQFNGIAYDSKILFYDIHSSSYEGLILPDDLNLYFKKTKQDIENKLKESSESEKKKFKLRVFSNSWGYYFYFLFFFNLIIIIRLFSKFIA
jgi:hypothetical protein